MSDSSPWPGRIETGLSFLVALLFCAAAVPKLGQIEFEVEAFGNFGLPLWSMLLVGVFEVIAAVMLVIRRATTLGAIIGVGIMINAFFAHIHAAEYPNVVPSLVVTAMLVWLGLRRRHAFADWISPRG